MSAAGSANPWEDQGSDTPHAPKDLVLRHFFSRRNTLAVTAVGASAALLVACSEPAEDTATTDAPASTAAATGETTTITVYTSEPEEKVDEINAAFEAANPDIKVEVYRASTGDLNARIAAEKESGSIEADVLWAADSATFETYKAAGDLAELQDVDTADLIEEAVDADNHYVGTRIIPTIIAYNTDIIDEADAPQSWADLVDPGSGSAWRSPAPSSPTPPSCFSTKPSPPSTSRCATASAANSSRSPAARA